MITGYRDTDFETLLKLDDKDFFKICAKFNFFKDLEKLKKEDLPKVFEDLKKEDLPKDLKKEDLPKDLKKEDLIPLEFTSKGINKLCNNENLWRRRLFERYGEFYPQDGQTWKNLYLKLVYYIDKYKYKKDNESFQNASFYGHLEVVKYLVSLPEEYNIKPSYNKNEAIRWASRTGHLDIVKYLMSLPKEYNINPSASNNKAIKWASENGHLDVVKYLILTGLVDPSASNNYAIKFANRRGQLDIVDFLLSLPKEYGVHL